MRLLCFAKGSGDAPSTRQRVLGCIEVAKKQGWKTQLVPVRAFHWWKFTPQRAWDFFLFWRVLREVDRKTIVLLQRTLRRREFLWLLRKFRKRIPYIVSDFDDAVWIHSPKEVEIISSLSDEVWCGSDEIMQHFTPSHPRVRFVPTTIDTSLFSMEPREEAIPVVGWVGDIHAHIENLCSFAETMKTFYADPPAFMLRLIGVSAFQERLHKHFSFLGERFQLIGRVPPAQVPQEISKFSIGIMPLDNNAFNKGKSALKLIEYLGAGVPVIASDVGENARVVQAPSHGFLASSPSEWKSAFNFLLEDAAVRHAKGSLGRQFVRSNYDNTIVYTALLQQLRGVLLAKERELV